MAEDLCLIQYVRDNFGEEYIHNYVNIADEGDDTMETYCLDFNTFTESAMFDHPSVTAGAESDTTPFTVPDLFSSPSPCTDGPATAMESNDGPYQCSIHSSNGEAGLQVSFLNHLQTFDRPHPKNSNELGSMFNLSYVGLPQANNIQLEDFHLQRRHSPGQGFEGSKFTLDEMLLEQSAANCNVVKTSSTSGMSNSCERRTSFWRGKSPALLMQQLKGPSLSASSSSSEARSAIKSPLNQFHTSSTLQGPRSALNLATLSSRDNLCGADIRRANLPVQPVSTLSKPAPSFSGQRLLPPLGDHVNIDSARVSSGRVGDQGRTRILRSSSFDPQLIASKSGVVEKQAAPTHLEERRKIMPGLAILGEMQRDSASGNCNSWSSSSTSPPGPSSNIDQDKDMAGLLICSTMSVDREMVGGDRARKKAKGELQGSTSSEGGTVRTVNNVAAALVEQREKSQLREKILALLQTDSSTSKVYKAKILDDTIRYLEELRKRLDVNEADSTRNNVIYTQAESPATSSRGRKYGDHGLASPIHLEDLELETAGVEISPHLNVGNGPQIEVRMMENQHVMVKLTARDRPGLFYDIMVVLRSLRLDIQHANIRTGNSTGQRHDIFAAKMQLPFHSSQSTHSIAMALNQVISATATPLASPEPHTPQI